MKVFSRIFACLLAFLLATGGGIPAFGQQFSPAIADPTGVLVASQIPTVSVNTLPPEVKTTLRLIDQGGPFPYAKDGTIFGNRERLLPAAPRGHYREYTVPTPGIRGRGARRLVVGKKIEIYYTGDHYRSFVRVRR